MSAGDPERFNASWLRFDPQRPARPQLLTRFIAAMIGMLILCALLAMFTH